jgi:uncharacterized phage protein gp47/JayE
MPITDTTLYRSRDDILAEMLALLVASIPDAYVGDDGNWRITFEIQAGQLENLFLANQLLLEDMFITTASYSALLRHGEQYQVAPKGGTLASGSLTFSGGGGTYIPIGAEAAHDPGGGLDPVFFNTTIDGTLPNPGIPSAPTIADGGAGGIPAGLYEYGVTFQTSAGETELGATSNALALAASHQITVTGIPVGGPGTTARNLYRRVDGGAWTKLTNASIVTTLNNNTTTSIVDGSVTEFGGPPPEESTAEQITLAAAAVDPGEDGNVATGTVNVLSDAPSTLTGVVNPVPFTGGAEPEDTEEFRQRLLEWIRNPQTGSPSDLQAIAESVAGVESATVFPNVPTNGSVTVRISGPGGSVPDPDVQANVLSTLQDFDIANITIYVSTFTSVPTDVIVAVTTGGTYTLTDVTPSVTDAIANYINGLAVGETLRISAIIDAVFGLSGIDDVVVTEPASNLTTAADSKRTPGTITVET